MHSLKLTVTLLLLSYSLFSQIDEEVVAPYLCDNGKYGLGNHQGEVVVPCDFDKVMYLYNPETFRMSKGGVFSFYSKKGEFLGDEFSTPIMPIDLRLRDMNNNLIDSVILLQCNVSKNFSLSKKDNRTIQIHGKADYYQGPFDTYQSVMQPPTVFSFGLAFFMQRDGLINIVDSELNILLDRGYSYISLLNKDFIAAYENKAFKLVNIRTNTSSSASFTRILESHSPELFIVNSLSYDDRKEGEGSPNAKIVNARGEVISPMAYHLILPAGKNHFIGKIQTDYYMLDQDGKRLHKDPVKSVKYLAGDFVEVYDGNDVHLYTTSWKKVFDDTFRRVESKTAGERDVIVCFKKKSAMLYDAKGLQFIDEIEAQDIFSQENANILFCKNLENRYFNYNVETKVETPSGTKINLYSVAEKDIYVVQQDSTLEILDIEFNSLIGPIKGQFEIDQSQNAILIKPYGSKLFDVYDGEEYKFTGNRVAHIRFNRNKDLAFHNLAKGEALLRNGEIFDASDYKVIKTFILDKQVVIIARFKGSEDYYVLNENFENITPSGYSLKRNTYDQRSIENGLIVLSNTESCGVIDSHGKWVFKPDSYKYKGMSSNIVRRENPTVAYRFTYFVKSDGIWKELDEAYFKFENEKYLIAWEERGDIIYSYVLDTNGEVLIAKEQGKIQMKGTYFVRYTKKNEVINSTIYSSDGSYMFDVPFNIVNIYDDYLMARDGDSKAAIIDLNGNVLASGIESDITYFPSFELYNLQSRDNTNLYHLSGEVFLAGNNSVYIYDESEGDEYLFCRANGITRVIDTSKTILYETPYDFKRKNNYLTEYFEFFDDNKKAIYISRLTFKPMVE